MKAINLKSALLIVTTFFVLGCSSFKGSANDTTGTNGATNGNGKVITTGAHNYDTK